MGLFKGEPVDGLHWSPPPPGWGKMPPAEEESLIALFLLKGRKRWGSGDPALTPRNPISPLLSLSFPADSCGPERQQRPWQARVAACHQSRGHSALEETVMGPGDKAD